MATLEKKYADWITLLGDAVAARVQWQQAEQVKSDRLASAKQEIDSIADELKELSKYSIDVKHLVFFTKSIDSMSGKGQWDPQNEIDTGRDVKRLKKEVPVEVQKRLKAAQDRILKFQQDLQRSVPKEQFDAIRGDFDKELNAAKQKAQQDGKEIDEAALRKQVQELLAAKHNCPPCEISQIELEGAVPPNEWSLIRDPMNKAKAKLDQETKAFKALEKEVEQAQDKPSKILAGLKKKAEQQKKVCELAQDELQKTRAGLAKTFKVTTEQIDDVVGWEPFFSDLEMRKELWKPLMRSEVIPDNVIPDAFNETVQQFRGGSDLYQQRLAQEFANSDGTEGAQEGLDSAKFVLKKCTTMAHVVVKAAGGPEGVGTVVQCVDIFGQAMLSGAKSVLKKDIEGVFDAVSDIFAQSVTTALGKDNKDLAMLMSGTFRATAKTTVSITKLIEDPKKNWQGFVAGIGTSIQGSFALCGTDPESKAMFTQIGKSINDAFISAVVGGKIIEALKKDPPNVQDIVDAVSSAAQRGFTRGLQDVAQHTDEVTIIKDGHVKETAPDTVKKQTMEKDLVGIGTTDVGALFASLKNNPKLMEKVKGALEKAEAEATNDEIEAEMEDFKAELALGFGAGIDDPKAMQIAQESNSLDKLINQVNADRALLKMADAIFNTGFKTAAEFFEPLKIASSGKDFVKNLIMAVRRALELKDWIELRGDALNAASVQGFAFANRVKNLKIQVSKRTLDALFELSKLVGATASCVPMSAGAGILLSKAATGAQALNDLIYHVREKADLQRQWNLYKRCLENPYDRTQMRDSIAGNPTLSKYAMAYAAVEEDDPIAKQGMRVCGINEATLKNPSTNAMKVVTYLETKFNDDPKLLKQLKKKPWQAAEIELKMQSWTVNKLAAKSKVKLTNTATGAIDAALVKVENTQAEFETAVTATDKAQSAFEAAQARYLPLYAEYTGALLAFRRGDKQYDLAKLKADQSQQTYDNTPQQDRTAPLVSKHLQTLNQYLNACETQQQRNETCATKMTPFQQAIGPFLTAADTYLGVVRDRSKVTAYRAALENLGSQLKRYKPLAESKDGQSEPCKEMQDYIDGLQTLVGVALRTAKEEEDLLTNRENEAVQQREEGDAHRDEIATSMQQDVDTVADKIKRERPPIEQAFKKLAAESASLIAAQQKLDETADGFEAKLRLFDTLDRGTLKSLFIDATDLFNEGKFDESLASFKKIEETMEKLQSPKTDTASV